jgi:protein O-mannosyl-transferase
MRTNAIHLALLLLVIAITWFSALSATRVFDDQLFWGATCWQVDTWRDVLTVPQTPHCKYRSLRYVSYAIDHVIYGDADWGYHLTNVLLHAATTWMVYFVIRRVLVKVEAADARVAFVCAALWSMHPVHTDVVTYFSGRRDLLTTMFFVASFLAWPTHFESRFSAAFRAAGSMVLLVLALLSKEMAVTLPAVIVMWLLWQSGLRGDGGTVESRIGPVLRRFWLPLSMTLALIGVAIWYRIFYAPVTQPWVWHGDSPLTHTWSALASYARYLEWLVAPVRLYGDYSDFPLATSPFDIRTIVGLSFALIVWGGGLTLRNRAPMVSFGLLWFGGTLLPVSQIVTHHERLAEHYLYLPSIGLAIVVAAGLRHLRMGQGGGQIATVAEAPGLAGASGSTAATDSVAGARVRLGWLVVAATAVVWWMLVQGRNADFTSNERFNAAVMEHVPDAFRARVSLAQAWSLEGDPVSGQNLLRQLLSEVEPGTERAAIVLSKFGESLAQTGQLSEAEQVLRETLRIQPDNAHTRAILSTVLARTGRAAEALTEIEQTRAIDSFTPTYQVYHGVTLLMLGRAAEAVDLLLPVAVAEPMNVSAQVSCGDALLQVGRNADAVERYAWALVSVPEDVRLLERAVAAGQQAEARAGLMERLASIRAAAPASIGVARLIERLQPGP